MLPLKVKKERRNVKFVAILLIKTLEIIDLPFCIWDVCLFVRYQRLGEFYWNLCEWIEYD